MSEQTWFNVGDHVHFHAHHGWYREGNILKVQTKYYPTSSGDSRVSTHYLIDMEGDMGFPIYVQHGFCHLGRKDDCTLNHYDANGRLPYV